MLKHTLLAITLFSTLTHLYCWDPSSDKTFTQKMLMGKKKEILLRTKKSVDEWQRKDDFTKTWGIEKSTSKRIYAFPSRQKQQRTLMTISEDYAKAAFDDEIIRRKKKNENASPLEKIRDTVNPKAQVAIDNDEKINLGIKGNILKQEATLYLKNPIIDSSFKNDKTGQWLASISKELKSFSITNTINYYKKTKWSFITQKRLTPQIYVQYTTHKASTPSPLEGDKHVGIYYQLLF